MMSPDALAQVRVNPDWASLPLFDRTGWTRVRFGDVVENCNESCDPVEAGLDRFIAMEHLEPGSLHVESWGDVADGTTFTRRCRPGQVLFGRRRAYQRKVAVAEFEAVVSGDIYVLAPKDVTRLLPELLPFVCLSERFFQHAVGTSAGSLSPRTKWDSLASFEFDLPPLDSQRSIAQVLLLADGTAVASEELVRAVNCFQQSFMGSALRSLPTQAIQFRTVQELVDAGVIESPQDGNHGELHPKSRDYVATGVPFVMANDLQGGRLALGTCKRIPEAVALRLRIGFARPGDVLLSHKGTIGLTAIVPGDAGDFIMLTPQVTYYRVRSEAQLRPAFLLATFRSDHFQDLLRVRAKQSTRDYIGILAQKEIPLLVPDVDHQDRILGRLDAIESLVRAAKAEAEEAKALVRALIGNAQLAL